MKCEEESKGKENLKNLKVCVDQVKHHDTVFAPIVAHRDTFRGEPDGTHKEQAGKPIKYRVVFLTGPPLKIFLDWPPP